VLFRSWEKLLNSNTAGSSVTAQGSVTAFDRRELIIQIFASRAQTREAQLQVELAELQFRLPRLTHRYIGANLNRQRASAGGARGRHAMGAGETRYETDRRQILQRIAGLKTELAGVQKQRAVARGQRRRQGVPVCALVGYTNSGKSTLLNALCGGNQDAGRAVYTENKLFATLDTTTRRLKMPPGAYDAGGRPPAVPLVVDTVGFIRRLPHTLVDAFRSTLEEAVLADLLVVVIDASDSAALEHYQTTMEVLDDIRRNSPGQKDPATPLPPVITALNKVDNGPAGSPVAPEILARLAVACPNAAPVSARTGQGLDVLKAEMLRLAA
jgi:GTP-binding protein HflX